MAEYTLLMPKMGESVIEATIIVWHKKEGDTVSEHEVILEVATDKVDSEVPSPVNGVIKKILHQADEAVGVGEALAILEIEGEGPSVKIPEKKKEVAAPPAKAEVPAPAPRQPAQAADTVKASVQQVQQTIDQAKLSTSPPAEHVVRAVPPASGGKFYSPLVMSIAQAEQLSMQELESIPGSGLNGRVTKEDILAYVALKKSGQVAEVAAPKPELKATEAKNTEAPKPSVKAEPSALALSANSSMEIIEMDRMRKLIAQHMVNSKKTSAHVSSFMECDVTNIVRWREKHKDAFQKQEGFSLSFMPVFIDAIIRAIKEYPMVNVSVDGDRILRKKNINIGVATALPTGNLIVPVLKQADQMSLLGIAKAMQSLVIKARSNSLQPDDISDGTYTITNLGTFGNLTGTPIINQPQVAIMAVGAITKRPVVMEVDGQDVIAIRHMMYLSHTYDHRVVDGMLGGLFVKKVAEFLEKFDIYQEI